MHRITRNLSPQATLLLAAIALAGCIHPSLARYAVPETVPTEGPLTVRFLGTATLVFDDGSTAIMTDGFFSRPSLWRVLLGEVEPNHSRIESALARAQISRLAAVFVAHSHYDHAMDSAAVARKTGAVVVGSESTANIALGDGLPRESIRELKDADTLIFGRFKVTAFRTPHAPEPKFPGEIEEPLHPPARASAYREGGNFSFLVEHDGQRILIVASANFSPGRFANVKADVVFLGIGALGKQSESFADAYWREVVQTTGARVVIPIHWDDFMRPLDEPLQPFPRPLDDFDNSIQMLLKRAQRDGVEVRLPRSFAPLSLTPTPR